MVKTHQFTEARRATQARPEVRRPCHAFTLIELLVVCGIIAILASLLLPGLARAKTKAHNSLCISNLRELGMATRLYSEDNQNRLPSAEILPTNPIDPQRPLPRICDVLAHVLGTTATSNSATVFKCPDDRVGLFASEGSSYEWNADLNGHQIDETKTAVLYRVWQPMEAPPGARTERCFSRPRRRRCCSIMRTSISARRNLARTSCSWMGMLLLVAPLDVPAD
ncbi:conserved exported hypothetical protein [Verrucomicrobia bacterium]|nr:conserved exported hypothetical protein [Verrucomicrobiota bacterium]